MDKLSYLSNAENSYIEGLYLDYQKDANSVDSSWQRFFEGFEFSMSDYDTETGEVTKNSKHSTQNGSNGHPSEANGSSLENGFTDSLPAGLDEDKLKQEISVKKLIDGYRLRGHLQAKTNPIRPRRDRKARLDLEDFGFTEADLTKKFRAGNEIEIGEATLQEIIDRLKMIYESGIGFEFMSIREPDVKYWFRKKVEVDYPKFKLDNKQKERILQKLNEASVFEHFLHTKYLGQKRFSLEGGESTIPALDAIISEGAKLGVEEVVIGMAHRGRLNVLVNIMGKTYAQVFNEFEGNVSDELLGLGDGDVKYHMGYSSQVETPEGNKVYLRLAPNPSHLEAVAPVVQGYTRAKLDYLHNRDSNKALPILIHGDAALAGQGIVYEVAQMSELEGYNVGGTIHFVINNQVGFTTDFYDGRSSNYCTDISQLTETPEIHVNGDDPEAVVFAVRLATEYRQKFHKDVYVDMVCYRKYGHNEADEPKFTQPQLYNLIDKHPNPRKLYIEKLTQEGEITSKLAKDMEKSFKKMLQERLDDVRQKPLPYEYQELEQAWKNMRRSMAEDFDTSPKTSITQENIDKVGKALTRIPEGFTPLKQIDKLLSERNRMFFGDKILDWASAELLAYGSVILDGQSVRFTGQDVRRGTFSHRHAVLSDAETNEAYNSLDHIEEDLPKFEIFNSLLSEYGVLGFEFGYAMANPNALTIWEAQFGDFANGAQITIDQFITSSETKWQRTTGLVLLLPHGYEGQGPEHSNARPERFLQLSAEYNIIVANVTKPANFFHLMRRQMAWDFRKPCVLMSPKSLLRHPKVVSPLKDFTDGKFEEVYGDEYADKKKVKRVLLCSGKVYYDLLDRQEKGERTDIAIVRVEQLHPFPKKRIYEEINKYGKKVEVIWVQEEPENMGAWLFVLRMLYKEWIEEKRPTLSLISRKASSSPATGYSKVHTKTQLAIIDEAFDVK
jgi:2-oxoglutarate dehydrogenase E1 component